MDIHKKCIKNMIEMLFHIPKKDYVEFSKYFFRGFKNKKILKIAEDTYDNYNNFGYHAGYNKLGIYEGDEIKIYKMLQEYSKLNKKTREPFNKYQLTSTGIDLDDKPTSLHDDIIILMAYCRMFEIEEVPLIDRKCFAKKFKTRHIAYIDNYYVRYDYQTDHDDALFPRYLENVYVNPKLVQRIIKDDYFLEDNDDGNWMEYYHINNLNLWWWDFNRGNEIGVWCNQDEDDESEDSKSEDGEPSYTEPLIRGILSNYLKFDIFSINREIERNYQNINELSKNEDYIKFIKERCKDICIICLEKYLSSEKMIMLQCGHILHFNCYKNLGRVHREDRGRLCPMKCYKIELWDKRKEFVYGLSLYDYYNKD